MFKEWQPKSALAWLERFGEMIPFSKNGDRVELSTQWMDFSWIISTVPQMQFSHNLGFLSCHLTSILHQPLVEIFVTLFGIGRELFISFAFIDLFTGSGHGAPMRIPGLFPSRGTVCCRTSIRNPSIFNIISRIAGTSDSSTKRVMFQVFFFSFSIYKNKIEKFWVP